MPDVVHRSALGTGAGRAHHLARPQPGRAVDQRHVDDEVQRGGVAAVGHSLRRPLPLGPTTRTPAVSAYGRQTPAPSARADGGVVTETGRQPGPRGWIRS